MTYWMNVSIDGFIEAAPGEDGGGSWMHITDELHREFNRRAKLLAASVEGRVTYEIMEAYWPTAADDPSESDVAREYGRIWLDTRKYLVSTTRTEAGHGTTIIGGDDAIEQLAQLRATTVGDIGVGGATLATALLRQGLLDELQLTVHPAVLGAGRPLFDELDAPLDLELLEELPFPEGVIMRRFAIHA